MSKQRREIEARARRLDRLARGESLIHERPGFCEVDMVAHGGTSVAGSFIQTLTRVDVATGWTECLPLVNRDGSLIVETIKRALSPVLNVDHSANVLRPAAW